jgi:hypothetical protein
MLRCIAATTAWNGSNRVQLAPARARRERLLARLELSREYERKMEKIDGQLGLTRLNNKLENQLWPRLSDLERRIYSAPAVTRADLAAKLALYDADTRHDWLVKMLLRDLRRLAELARSRPNTPGAGPAECSPRSCLPRWPGIV